MRDLHEKEHQLVRSKRVVLLDDSLSSLYSFPRQTNNDNWLPAQVGQEQNALLAAS